MAKPIIDSPVLTGRDADRLRRIAENIVPATQEYMAQFHADVEFMRKHANFEI